MKKSTLVLLVFSLVLLFYSEPAMAHNCSGLQDCYQQSKLAALAAALIALLLSLLLDFSPIGYWKGLLEAITGRDILTGDKLAWWQRALNLVPGGKGARTAAKAVDEISDTAKAVNKVSDAAKVGEEIGDSAKAAGKMEERAKAVNEVGDVAKAESNVAKAEGETAKAVDEVSDVAKAESEATKAVLDNLNRFQKRLPRDATPIRTYNLPNGGKAFQADVPAKNISGSYATYEKQIDADGITRLYTKTTYAPNGSIVHIKQKYP
ncbi:MAG: hypothetical protein EWV83_07195 [Microcystis sp. M_OC_Ca_00000000_S217Cul]|uniref:pre-toxin TG domain-containing protein n=1 Tax=unclassified Microcystis TaxID=2643300 RepID=UPI0011944A85|nr:MULTISPECIES: pre-toxin TG domain-containing protein [unclassified Microcystis]TRT78164.1 MAG: hypothetical protein EWV83_07195 [Microcystis sp. M_OC_Ca_00000000_S217Cul]TRT91096.1 MAG: hypothetical protein EWV66_06990 [Microcystis sp. M_OC_Ca_00000000_C217Col]